MHVDLYGALGVNRDAPIGVIKGAYRRAAKKAHPDGGGSVEKFALIKLAADILGDEKRRRRYDETGNAEEARPEQSLSNAMELAFMTIQNCVTECLQRGRDPETCDLVASASQSLRVGLRAIDDDAKNRHKQIKMAKAVAKRFRSKTDNGENIFAAMWAAQIAAMEDGVRVAGADRTKIEMALAILGDHAFDVRVAERPADQMGRPMGGFMLDMLNRSV